MGEVDDGSKLDEAMISQVVWAIEYLDGACLLIFTSGMIRIF